jgi:PAS domain S-box-containing protein
VRVREQVLRAWRWLASNSFAPAWLPEPWRRIWVGYGIAVLAQLLAVALTTWVAHMFPEFGSPGLLPALAIVLVALNCGSGPSLLATVVGALLLDYLIVPPHGALTSLRPGDAIGLSLLVAVGIIVGIFASRKEGERRRAQALAGERAAMLEAVPDPFFVFDETGRIVQANSATHDLLGSPSSGASPEEPATLRISRLEMRDLQGRTIAREHAPLMRILRGGTLTGKTSEDVMVRAFSGRELLLNVSGAPVRDREGRLFGAALVMRDVGAQRRLEAEVRASELQLRATFDQAAVGIALEDLDGRLFRVNQKLAAMLGYSIDELTGLRAEDLGHPADLVPERAARERMMGGGLSSAVLEKRYQHKNGGAVWTNLTLTLVRDDAGAPQYFAAIIEDVTARRALERRTHEALGALLAMAQVLVAAEPEEPSANASYAAGPVARRLAELTASVLGCRRVSISAIDPESTVMRPVAVAGLSPEQEQRWHLDQQTEQRLADWPDQQLVARLRDGEVITLDLSRPPYSGQPNPYQIRDLLMAPMRIGEQLVGLLTVDYSGVAHTYTPDEKTLAGAVAKLLTLVVERERLFMQREEARSRVLALHDANRRMNDFLGVASHELKTPVTSLKVNVQLATRWLARLTRDAAGLDPRLASGIEPIRDVLERSDRTMVRLTRLVDDLLDVSRIRAGRLELRPERCDLATIILDAVQEQRAVVAEVSADRAISCDLPPTATFPVFADPDRIGQVLTNYLTNAVKYSPDSAPVAVRVAVVDPPAAGDAGTEHTQRLARVAVRDRGPGLPPQELEHIWEAFHRAEGVTVQSGSGVGLGLGLFISRTIVERHSGQVGVESAPGHGSTFWFTLPLAEPE